jgi:thiamine biosynthesis lipoprotein
MTDWLKSNLSFLSSRESVYQFLKSFRWGVLTIVGCLLFSCTSEPKIYKNQNVGGALGTSYSLIYLSKDRLDFQKEIDSVFVVINQSMSTYIPTSDISKINQGDSTVVIDQKFRDVFELSKEVYEKTNGHFDPTVGVLVDAWGFGPGKQLQMNKTRIDSLMDFVGFDKVRLNDNNTISKTNAAIRFDFNAIAKGYAIDRLGALLVQKGLNNFLIEVGGEVLAKGQNTFAKRRWGVEIQDPEAERARNAIYLENRAMASSGNYRKFRIDSVTRNKYVHTVDPKTGYTKNSKTLGANVLANTCAVADAYATAFMVMDLQTVIEFVSKKEDLEVYIIYLNEAGETQEYMSEGFKEAVIKK